MGSINIYDNALHNIFDNELGKMILTNEQIVIFGLFFTLLVIVVVFIFYFTKFRSVINSQLKNVMQESDLYKTLLAYKELNKCDSGQFILHINQKNEIKLVEFIPIHTELIKEYTG